MSDSTTNGGRRLVAISAHPDDVEFTSGGTLARWSDEGWDAQLIVCTDGGKGSADPLLAPRELAALRRREQQAAAAILGVQQVIWLDYPDGELARAAELVERLTALVRQLRPERLLTWDPWKPYQLHPDHRAAGWAALDAILAAGNPHYFPTQLIGTVQPHRVAEVYLYGSDAPDQWIDITAHFERKLRAIASHSSQVAAQQDLTFKLTNCNRDYGARCGCGFAEAFKVLRPFCDT